MNLIVVTDIFGKTSELNEFCSQYSGIYDEVIVVDPYGEKSMNFDTEKSAYQYFQQHCEIKNLSEKLEKEIVKSGSIVDIVGFSVGGTSAWVISEKSKLKNIRKVVCFYSSRIRENTDICPNISTKLVFPRLESNFDLEPVIQSIEDKHNVEAIRTNYLHGFMNKKSINSSDLGYQYFSKWLSKEAG